MRTDRIHILADNAGGLYLHLVGPDIVVGGIDPYADALTDCRLVHEWLDDVHPDHLHGPEAVGGLKVVASYDPGTDTLTPETRYPGIAARRYCGRMRPPMSLWTDAKIRDLLTEAGEAGDTEQVVRCLEALGKDDGRFPEVARIGASAARLECARVIADARAQED